MVKVKGAAVAAGAAGLLTMLAGCARPEAVRNAASASQPIVVELRNSGAALQQRFQAQRDAFAARAANTARLTATAKARTEATERAWRMMGQESRLKQLEVIREQDERIRLDPLSPLSAPAAAQSKADEFDAGGLKRAITALDRLKGAERMTAAELRTMAEAVREEQTDPDTETGGDTPPASALPQQN